MSQLKALILGSLMAALIISVFSLALFDINTNYGVDVSGVERVLNDTNVLTNISREIVSVKNQTVGEGGSEVTREGGLDALVVNAFNIGQFIVTGGPIKIIYSMTGAFIEAVGMPPVVNTFLFAVIGLIATFAIVRLLTGRG